FSRENQGVRYDHAASEACAALAERLTAIYVAEGHGPGGFDLELTSTSDDEPTPTAPLPALPVTTALDLALRRLFGMARTPRFSREEEPPMSAPSGDEAERWRATLLELAGAGHGALLDEGGLDDGFTLFVRAADGRRYRLLVDQAHD